VSITIVIPNLALLIKLRAKPTKRSKTAKKAFVGVGVVVDSASVGVVAGLLGISMVVDLAGLSVVVDRKKNDIVLYYNTKNNEIEYLYGQQNDIEVEGKK
jgi:hypothetical protein